jgi:hypothetical protein
MYVLPAARLRSISNEPHFGQLWHCSAIGLLLEGVTQIRRDVLGSGRAVVFVHSACDAVADVLKVLDGFGDCCVGGGEGCGKLADAADWPAYFVQDASYWPRIACPRFAVAL